MALSEIQTARTTGFKDQLAKRGISLQLQPSGPSYSFLIEIVPPDPARYTLSDETRDSAILHLLRTDLGAQVVKVGDTFKNITDANVTYRVTRVENSQLNIAVKFHCEVTFP